MKYLEIELKTLLKKDEYTRLIKQFASITPILQKITTLTHPISNLEKKRSPCALEPLMTGQN